MRTGRPAIQREAIVEKMKARGTTGVSVDTLAMLIGSDVRVVKSIVAKLRDDGHPVHTVSRGRGIRVYVWGRVARGERAIKLQGPNRRGAPHVIICRLEKAMPHGVTREALGEGLSVHACNRAIERLRETGEMFTARMPGMGGAALYFRRREDMQAAVETARIAEAERVREYDRQRAAARRERLGTPTPKSTAKRRPASRPVKSIVLPKSATRQPPKAPPVPAGPVIVPEHVTVQRLPSGADSRWTVEQPTPYFAALAVGSYAPDETWAARVYGGRA